MYDAVKEEQRKDCPLGYICYAKDCDPEKCRLEVRMRVFLFSWEQNTE